MLPKPALVVDSSVNPNEPRRRSRRLQRVMPLEPVERPQNQRPALLTVRETADLLRTTHTAIYAKVERGQLPGVVHVGRRVLINEQVLLDWLSRNTTSLPERSER